MADPQALLTSAVARAMEAAFGADARGVDPTVRPTNNPAFGDFQANFAMQLGKRLRRPPRELAEAIVAELDLGAVCERVFVAGPGFVNLTLDDGWLGVATGVLLGDDRLGVAKDPVPAPQALIIGVHADHP